MKTIESGDRGRAQEGSPDFTRPQQRWIAFRGLALGSMVVLMLAYEWTHDRSWLWVVALVIVGVPLVLLGALLVVLDVVRTVLERKERS